MSPELMAALGRAFCTGMLLVVFADVTDKARTAARDGGPQDVRWLTLWSGSFAAALAAEVLLIASLVVPDLGSALTALAALGMVPAIAAQVAGTRVYLGREAALGRWIGLASAAFIGAVALYVAASSVTLAGLPLVVAYAASTAWAGVVFSRGARGRGSVLAGAGLFGMTLHSLAIPWLMEAEGARALLWASATMVELLGGAGLLLIERDRAHRQHLDAVADMSAFMEDAVVGVYRSSPHGFSRVNRALVDMLGYDSVDEVLALKLPEDVYVDPDEHRAVNDAADGGTVSDVEVTWRRKDGSTITVALSGREVHHPDGRFAYWEGFVRDVSESRRLAAELAKAQQLEAVGRLAGGIAHDFNNLLTTTLANLDMLRSTAAPDQAELVYDALSATRRASALTRRLLALGQPEAVAVGGTSDLVATVEETLRLLRSDLAHLEVRSDLPHSAVWVGMAEAALTQVIMNLVLNAAQAQPDGGTLKVTVHTGGEPQLVVQDGGPGMPEHVRAHVFEPFFTTRTNGHGLGLASTWALVAACKGRIGLDTEPGSGTTFTISLPSSEAPSRPRMLAPTPVPQNEDGQMAIVVDDEAEVRRAMVRALQHQGYVVRDADNAGTALRWCLERRPDLLVCDVMMPRMTGPELYQRLVELDRAPPTLLVTGYAADAIPTDLGVPVLFKPFEVAQLQEAMREVGVLTPL